MNDDRTALDARFDVSTPGTVHTLLHYLYVPTEAAAVAAGGELREGGFRIEERRSADGIHWLVRARHDVIPSERGMAVTRQLMRTLAARHGGEYDGWEAAV